METVSRFDELVTEFRRFVDDRDWRQFHDPKSLILALVGEVGELAELYQWIPASEAAARASTDPLRSRTAQELADVLLYLVGLADALGVDLIEAAHAKLADSTARFPAGESYGVAPDKASS